MTDSADQPLVGAGQGGRFARLPAAATFDPRLSPAALRVLAALASYVNPRGQCFPAVGTVAARLGLTRRQVQRHLRSLERAGYVATTRRKRIHGGGWSVNVYMLAYPAVPAPVGESQGAGAEGAMPAGGQRADAMQGQKTGNGSDATSDDASGPARPGDGESDATSGGTSDASSDAARTSLLNSPKRDGGAEKKTNLLPDGPAGRFGKKASKVAAGTGLADPAQRKARWRQRVMGFMANCLRDDPAVLSQSFELIAADPDGADARALLDAWDKAMRADPAAAGSDG